MNIQFFRNGDRVTLILFILFLAASASDLKRFRVKNGILLAGALLVTLMHLCNLPAVDGGLLLGGLFVLMQYCLFRLGLGGGGDVKMYLLVLYAWPSMRGVRVMLLSLAAAAALSVGRLITDRGLFKRRMQKLRLYIAGRWLPGSSVPGLHRSRRYYDLESDREALIPMAFCILVSILPAGFL